jgi:putative membrane protein
MKKIVLSLMTIAFMGTSQAQTLSERDKKFILLAAEGGMMEAQLGQYATQKAESPNVRDLGKVMVGDHSKANEELRGLASRKKTSLPANLSDKKQKEVNALKEKKGRDFDEAYSKFMVQDHQDHIAIFNEEAEKGDDLDVKAWAAKMVSTLERHKKLADETCEILNK